VSRTWRREGLRGNGNGESWGRRVRLDVLPAASEPCPETTYADQILRTSITVCKMDRRFFFNFFSPAAMRSYSASAHLAESQSRRGIHSSHARALCLANATGRLASSRR
jgi:hypothetical protein